MDKVFSMKDMVMIIMRCISLEHDKYRFSFVCKKFYNIYNETRVNNKLFHFMLYNLFNNHTSNTQVRYFLSLKNDNMIFTMFKAIVSFVHYYNGKILVYGYDIFIKNKICDIITSYYKQHNCSKSILGSMFRSKIMGLSYEINDNSFIIRYDIETKIIEFIYIPKIIISEEKLDVDKNESNSSEIRIKYEDLDKIDKIYNITCNDDKIIFSRNIA